MTNDQPLTSRTAVVTGASAGIGEATAAHLASLGATIVLNARREARLEALAQRLSDEFPTPDGEPRVLVAAGDAADDSVIHQMLTAAPTTPDLVVVNAGRGLNGSVMTSDPAQWDEMIRTNLLAAAKLIRAAGERLVQLQQSREWPTTPADIVVVGSTVGRHISPFSSMYGSTKFAVNALAEAARRELGPKRVRVTLVEPGIVKSEFQSVAGYDEQKFGDLMESIDPVLTPEDVARTIGFICAQPAGVNICDVVIRPTRQEYP